MDAFEAKPLKHDLNVKRAVCKSAQRTILFVCCNGGLLCGVCFRRDRIFTQLIVPSRTHVL